MLILELLGVGASRCNTPLSRKECMNLIQSRTEGVEILYVSVQLVNPLEIDTPCVKCLQ